jgi:hypothetical protein
MPSGQISTTYNIINHATKHIFTYFAVDWSIVTAAAPVSNNAVNETLLILKSRPALWGNHGSGIKGSIISESS